MKVVNSKDTSGKILFKSIKAMVPLQLSIKKQHPNKQKTHTAFHKGTNVLYTSQCLLPPCRINWHTKIK